VVYPDTTSLDLSRWGFYEEGLTRAILGLLKPGMTFFNVGAHIGYYTLMAAWLVGDQGQVHSFEPTPGTFELLQGNSGHKPNIRLNNVAVYSVSGLVSFNDYGTNWMGNNSIFTAKLDPETLGNTQDVKYEVPATTVDDYMRQSGAIPDFVKIDAENAEFDVLLGMQDTMMRNRPIVSLEVGDWGIEGVRPNRELIEFMGKNGYQAYDSGPSGFTHHSIKNHYEYDNLIFMPEN
jgi:FkbM family methyltransferase